MSKRQPSNPSSWIADGNSFLSKEEIITNPEVTRSIPISEYGASSSNLNKDGRLDKAKLAAFEEDVLADQLKPEVA